MTEAIREGSLFERLGGIFGVAGVIDVLGDRLFENVTANQVPAARKLHDIPGARPGFKFSLTAWMIEETGGPKCYFGRDMRVAHEDIEVTDWDFDVVLMETAATLTYCGVPQREHREVMDIMESYRKTVMTAMAQKHGGPPIPVDA